MKYPRLITVRSPVVGDLDSKPFIVLSCPLHSWSVCPLMYSGLLFEEKSLVHISV